MTSSVTLERIPTAIEFIGEMVQNLIDERGAGDLFELKKMLDNPELTLEKIGQLFYNAVNDNNEPEMLRIGKCPECASTLVYVSVPATHWEPDQSRIECPKCHDEYNPDVVGEAV